MHCCVKFRRRTRGTPYRSLMFGSPIDGDPSRSKEKSTKEQVKTPQVRYWIRPPAWLEKVCRLCTPVAYTNLPLVWPSLSADTLSRLHNMLLEQPHLTVQHVALLASHFSVDKKHVEKFIIWRAACLQNCRVGQEQQLRPLPPSARGNEMMDVDEADAQSDGRPHLPTPAGSISPEPVHCKTPAIFTFHQSVFPSLDTSFGAIGRREVNWPPSPMSAISPRSQSRPRQGSSNSSQPQLDSPTISYLPSPPLHERSSNATSSQPSRTSPSDPPNVPTKQAGPSKPGLRQPVESDAPETSLSARLPPLPPIPTPRTLRELDEAYAPTYAKIERILQNVERGKFVHLGLIPEMLRKKIGP